jgi:two-component system chemotaxis response regulator CheY
VPSILLIDDDDQLRRMLRRALERDGYLVMEARDGREGSRVYRATPTDLIILDILMPEQEGLQTIRELRQTFPALKIIAISGGGGSATLNFLHAAELTGARRSLAQPFTLEELRGAVRQILQS